MADGDELACPVCSSPLVAAELEIGRAERIAQNEGNFRKRNEAAVAAATQPDGVMSLVCECGSESCHDRFEVGRDRYEAIRSDSLQFFVLPGHQLPDVEDVVVEEPGYFVVRKVWATKQAEASDPRS